MSRKNLQVDDITNELHGSSLFFKPNKVVPTPLLPPSESIHQKIPDDPLIRQTEETKSLSNENKPIFDHPNDGNNEQTIKIPNERINERNNERSKVRRKIRHTFDIFTDQLLGLREITIQEEKYTGERVLIGDLAQQALDMFITKYRNKQR